MCLKKTNDRWFWTSIAFTFGFDFKKNINTKEHYSFFPLFFPLQILGYVFSGPPPAHYALPAVQAPTPYTLPFLSSELCRSTGRPNFNLNYSMNANGDDLPCNNYTKFIRAAFFMSVGCLFFHEIFFLFIFTVSDKVSLRFFYNLGIEYFKFLKQSFGYMRVMSMIDGDNVNSGYDQSPSVASDVDATAQQQLTNDFHQLNFDSNEAEVQSPPKVIENAILVAIV